MGSLAFTLIFVSGVVLLANAKFLWFEKAPNPDDRCTVVKYALDSSGGWEDVHPPPDCLKGGLLWYYTTGRIHAHFFIDPTKETDFTLCLTGGEANAIYIWYDYKTKYWSPMGFPNYQIGLDFKERCRRSHNGTMDLFFESPWHKLHFLSHVSWEITPLPPGTPEEEDDIDFSDLPDV